MSRIKGDVCHQKIMEIKVSEGLHHNSWCDGKQSYCKSLTTGVDFHSFSALNATASKSFLPDFDFSVLAVRFIFNSYRQNSTVFFAVQDHQVSGCVTTTSVSFLGQFKYSTGFQL